MHHLEETSFPPKGAELAEEHGQEEHTHPSVLLLAFTYNFFAPTLGTSRASLPGGPIHVDETAVDDKLNPLT